MGGVPVGQVDQIAATLPVWRDGARGTLKSTPRMTFEPLRQAIHPYTTLKPTFPGT
jgi:hypothetical protein